jgi:short-subunit dehydrogenase
MTESFAGKTALVTGAGSGIGRAVAILYGERGGATCLVGRTPEKLEAVAREVQDRGGQARISSCDLTREEQRTRLVEELGRERDGLDALVHCAGSYAAGRTEAVAAEDLTAMFAVNAIAPLALTRALLPLLRAAQGDVVFLNSSVVSRPAPGVAQYAASKHALRGIADALRAEINPDGVRVLSVFAGRTATPMQQRIFEAEGRSYRPDRLLQPEDVAGAIVSALALPRTAEVTDLHIRPARKS